MANKPYFLWGDTHGAAATSIAASDSGVGIFMSPSAPETPALAAATAASSDTAMISPELGAVAAAVARPRLRRDSSVSEKKKKKLQQQQQQAGGGVGVGQAASKKPPQRGLGVAELERLRCGGDPLLELSATVVGDAAAAGGAQGHGHPLLHFHHHGRHHLQMPVPAASAFEAAAGGARFCSQLLAPTPAPACGVLHPPPAAAAGFQFQRAAPPPVAPEQQYLRDRWSRMGGFSTACGGGDLQSQLLMPATMAPPPEHPSSQNTTIWRPAVSSSSCLHTGLRCDVCSRRMRGLAENGGALAAPPTPPDYSIYDLATAMATARHQGDAFLARERKQGAAEADAPPAKKDVREIEFFPAASAHHAGGGARRFSVSNESEFAAPFSSPSPYGGGHTAPQLDLSLRL